MWSFCRYWAHVSNIAKFKGGKGAATACGMLFGVEPVSIAISFTMFGLIILLLNMFHWHL